MRKVKWDTMPHIPADIAKQLTEYVMHGAKPGGLLYAILRNNLCEAMSFASKAGIDVLAELVEWMYTALPSAIIGTEDRIRAHCDTNKGDRSHGWSM